jgi:hypothetical protein
MHPLRQMFNIAMCNALLLMCRDFFFDDLLHTGISAHVCLLVGVKMIFIFFNIVLYK